ncbi:MAG: metallophosphoesterase [Blastocatellia bacterium]
MSRDLKDKTDGMGFETLDYLVISGDLTNRATKEEFDNAYEFISGVIERFKLSAERCIIVPGNHDLSWDQEVYDWKQERLIDPKALQAGRYIKEGSSCTDCAMRRNIRRASTTSAGSITS